LGVLFFPGTRACDRLVLAGGDGMRTEVRLDPISPADREEIVDLFNHYVASGFAAFPDPRGQLRFL